MKSLLESCQKRRGETMETISFSIAENFVSIIFSLFRKKGMKNTKIDFWTFLKINKTVNIKIARILRRLVRPLHVLKPHNFC
jgi:hypothetical protein